MLDNTYIKMVLALLDEFFKDWKWQAGDKALIDNKEVFVLGFQNNYIWYYDRGELVFNLDYIKNDIAMIGKNELRPIPSQRQLQDMLIDPKTPIDLEVWKLLEEFQKFVSAELIRHHERGVHLENSFDVLWLKFVMFYKYKMLWKREVWVKIEENLSSGIGFS